MNIKNPLNLDYSLVRELRYLRESLSLFDNIRFSTSTLEGLDKLELSAQAIESELIRKLPSTDDVDLFFAPEILHAWQSDNEGGSFESNYFWLPAIWCECLSERLKGDNRRTEESYTEHCIRINKPNNL